MPDPRDAHYITKNEYHEVKFYLDIPELAENLLENLVEVQISKRTKVKYNTVTGSWMQVVYPFAENPELAGKYRKFADDDVIVGKMLEDIDAISAETAFRFIRGSDKEFEDVSTVTAAVDSLSFDKTLSVNENLKLNTYVIYTGSSTMYIKTDMYSQKPGDLEWDFKGHTIFIMAARLGDRSFKVPKLEFDGEEYPDCVQTRQMLGLELKDYIINLNNNLYKQAPDK